MESPAKPSMEKMRFGVEYRESVRVCGRSVKLRPLTIAETNSATSDVNRRFRQMEEWERHDQQLATMLSKATLIQASTTSPDLYDPQLTDKVLDQLTADELGKAYKDYTAIVARVNPMLEELTTEVVRDLVEDVKKNPARLIELSFMELTSTARYLLRDGSPTDRSSGGQSTP